MDAQQELFTKILTELRRIGLDVYDGELPPEGTPYPFVYVGENQVLDEPYKEGEGGQIIQTIHVWGDDPKARGTHSEYLRVTKQICRSITRTKNYTWLCTYINQRTISDQTTGKTLMHGVIEATFIY